MHAPPPVDLAKADHHAISRIALLVHAKVAVAVGHISVDLLEAAVVEQTQDALAGGELAFGVLGLNSLGAPTLLDLLTPFLQFFDQGGMPIHILHVLRVLQVLRRNAHTLYRL
jgi:hypothetical protein